MPNGITTDQLNIKITVDSSGATQGIDEVKKALGELRGIAESRNLTTLRDLADQFGHFSSSARGLSEVNFAGIGSGISNFFSSLAGAANPMFPSYVQATADALTKLTGPISDFTKHTAGLSAVASGLSNIQGALNKFGSGPSAEQIAGLADPLRQIGQAVGKVGKGGNNLNQMKNGIEGMTSAVKNFNPKDIGKIGPALQKLQNQVSRFSEDARYGASTFYRIANAMRSFNETGFDADLVKNIDAAADAVVRFVDKVVKSIPNDVYKKFTNLGTAINSMAHISGANRSVNSFANSLKRAHSYSSNFSKSMKKVRNSVLQTLFPFKSIAKSVSNFGNAFKKLGHTIQRLVLYRFLRSMIRAITQQVKLGIDALYNWSDVVGYRFKAAMDGLATSFQYLRNSVAAMLSPLVEYLQPVIDSLIDRFVEFLNVVNQFVATMTGKDTYVRAIKGAAKYAEETGYAAAAQEKLNRTVLGFDELNKLNDTDDRGRGSPTADAGGGEFEELPITESFGKIDWSNLGKKLSDGLATALGGINWPSIQEKTKGIVQKVVGFINGFFGNKEMWDAVGLTLSGALNTLTTAITTFADGGEWENIGANIQSAFENAVADINWVNLGKSIVSTLKIFTKLFHGFVSSMKPADWKELGTKIGKAINAAIQDIPWGQLLEDMLSFAAGLTDALIAAVKAIDWIKIGQEIKAWWTNKSPELKQQIIIDTTKALAGILLFSSIASGMKGLGGVTKAAGGVVSSFGLPGILGAIGLLIATSPEFYKWCDTMSDKLAQLLFDDDDYASYKNMSDEMDNLRSHGQQMLDELLAKGHITRYQYGMWLESMSNEMARTPEDVQNVVSDIERIYSGFEKGLPVKLNTFGKFLGDGTTVMERSGKKIGDSSTGMAQRFEAAGILINGIWSKLTIGTEKNTRIIGSSINASVTSIAKHFDATIKEIKDKHTPQFRKTSEGIADAFTGGLVAKKQTITQAAYSINSAVGQALQSGDPWTWGADFGYLFSRGLIHSAQSYIAPAAKNAAQSARTYLAFSKPEKGPLSDADKYGPDFMKLYAQGIENSKSLVTNAVSGLASDVNNAMALENTYTLHNEPTGLDSLAQAITNSETPINVYIGSDKLDSVIARSNSRLNYRSGGRF